MLCCAVQARGTCLASNQVQYSLIYRAPEKNGVLEACREHGTTLVAYSPLCQGLLTGKYSMQVCACGVHAELVCDKILLKVIQMFAIVKHYKKIEIFISNDK